MLRNSGKRCEESKSLNWAGVIGDDVLKMKNNTVSLTEVEKLPKFPGKGVNISQNFPGIKPLSFSEKSSSIINGRVILFEEIN